MKEEDQNTSPTAVGVNAVSEPLLTVYVVDDDPHDRERLTILLGRCGYRLRLYASAEEFLAAAGPEMTGCVVADFRMPLMSGLDLLVETRNKGLAMPFLVVSAYGDISAVRKVFHEGAIDFLEKPVATRELLDGIEKCFRLERQRLTAAAESAKKDDFIAALSERERQVVALVVQGQNNRQIGDALGISHRTVEVHKSRIMTKLGLRSTPELISVASQYKLASVGNGADPG